MLVVVSGLPGTGKTTIAQQVARQSHATCLRIDAIDQAVRSANVLADDIGPAGYAVAYALSEANLRLGQVVVADCVNPLSITRAAWRSRHHLQSSKSSSYAPMRQSIGAASRAGPATSLA